MRVGESGAEGARRRLNWIMAWVLAGSLAFHAWILAHIAGLYESRVLSYIELGIEERRNASLRDIPRPPERRKPPEAQRPTVEQARPLPINAVVPKPEPVPDAAQKGIAEPIHVPERPDVAMREPLSWIPSLTAPPAGPSSYGAKEDYLGMVRMKIESRKKYPPAARKMQMQGRVSVRFNIAADGTVSGLEVKEPVRWQLLNEAALEAVKAAAPFPVPPAQLFPDPVRVEVSIVFELM